VARSGEPTPGFEGKLARADGSWVDVLVSATPLFDEAGNVRGAIAGLLDISERKAAETHQQVLLYELQHRVKNIIATISALATRTLRGDMPAAQYAEAFQGRLRGMAGTHELLSRSNWAGADLRALVETALRSHASLDGDTLAIKGPDLLIAPAAASTLGMVFYELATNAAKYGGLAGPGGRVEVSWSTVAATPSNKVVMLWTETTGKPLPAAVKTGFGVTFVQRSIEYELQGGAEMEPQPRGVRWRLEFPFHQNVLHA